MWSWRTVYPRGGTSHRLGRSVPLQCVACDLLRRSDGGLSVSEPLDGAFFSRARGFSELVMRVLGMAVVESFTSYPYASSPLRLADLFERTGRRRSNSSKTRKTRHLAYYGRDRTILR